MTRYATRRRVACVIATARRYFRVSLTEALARAVIRWDDENDFVGDLEPSGLLDTAPRDYFGMALLAVLMPGKPSVQDELISAPLERWHWPLNGSSEDYRAAFEKAWRNALRKARA